MKKIKFLLCVLALVSLACENENDSIDVKSVELEDAFTSITGSVIGYERDGNLEIGVSDEKIMETFKEFVSKSKLDLQPQLFKIININNKNYLRFYHNDDKVSTIAIIKGSDNSRMLANTVCTTDYCASGGGCVPDGDYCTECPGDCSRSTSN